LSVVAERCRSAPWLSEALAAAACVTLGGVVLHVHKSPVHAQDLVSTKLDVKVDCDRVFSIDEFRTAVANGRIVVALRGEIYDVTEFTGHPGGVGRLALAAGGDLEVFWSTYTQHNRGHIDKILAPYKIGRISEADMQRITANTHFDAAAYENDPPPSPHLLVNTRYPLNAEGLLSTLADTFITPIGKHFVRNHASVPDIDPHEYTLTVSGEGLTETTFTLDQLMRQFTPVEVTTVIQCNGNRREDYHFLDGETPAFGPPHWVAGAIGNATWKGPRLRDVLRAAGMDVDAIALGTKEPPARAEQVGLVGYDHDEAGNQYCCSFPFDKAVDPMGDVILATHMNGEPIPREHGYPVRAIVPGHAGARNCKFLESVTVTDCPCDGHCNWKQYAVHAPDVPLRKLCEFEEHKKELKMDPAVQEMPVQSLITSPSPGDLLSAIHRGDESIYIRGVAWGGGGAGVNRVDVSLNDGKDFTRAEMIEKPIKERRRSQWSWVLFEKNVPLPEGTRARLKEGEQVELVLTSKALNASWNVQPEHALPNRNPHGCCVNHWYRVPVVLCPNIPHDVKAPAGDFANKPSGGHFATPFRHHDSPEEARRRKLGAQAAGDDHRRPLHWRSWFMDSSELKERVPRLPRVQLNRPMAPVVEMGVLVRTWQWLTAPASGVDVATPPTVPPISIHEASAPLFQQSLYSETPAYTKPTETKPALCLAEEKKDHPPPSPGMAPAPFDALGVSGSPLVLETPSEPMPRLDLNQSSKVPVQASKPEQGSMELASEQGQALKPPGPSLRRAVAMTPDQPTLGAVEPKPEAKAKRKSGRKATPNPEPKLEPKPPEPKPDAEREPEPELERTPEPAPSLSHYLLHRQPKATPQPEADGSGANTDGGGAPLDVDSWGDF